MKVPTLILLACAARAFAGSGPVDPFCTEVAVNAGSMTQVSVELIEVQSTEATRLLAKEKLGTDGAKLRAELETLITQGKASVFDMMLVTTRSGQRGTAESHLEVIYPTEYGPPELTWHVPPTPEQLAARAKEKRIYPPMPTAFETRNSGGILLSEPTLYSNNHVIEQRVEWQMVCEAGHGKWGPFKDISGNDWPITMPFFYSLNINTTTPCTDGVPALLSVLSPTSKKGSTDPTRKLLVLITADVVTAPPSK